MIDGIDDLEPEARERLLDAVTTIKAGLEQARSEIDMPWNLVPYKRINELGEQIAVLTVDWTAYDSFLVGTWLAASARHQLLETGAIGEAD